MSALQNVSSNELRFLPLIVESARVVIMDTLISAFLSFFKYGRVRGCLGVGTESRCWGWAGKPGGDLGAGAGGGEGVLALGGVAARGDGGGELLGVEGVLEPVLKAPE